MLTNEVVRAASGASQTEDFSVLSCIQKQTSSFQCACQSHGVSFMWDPCGRVSRLQIARAQVILRERKVPEFLKMTRYFYDLIELRDYGTVKVVPVLSYETQCLTKVFTL
eukprot:scaffold6486_cov96-Cylindrotheca_fusiformis.AAC.4